MAGYFSVNLGCFTLDPGVQNPWGPPYRKLLYKFEARFFPRVTPEPGLQFHANFNVGLCHVLNTLSCEEHDLRLLRKALFPGRYWAVSHAKTAFWAWVTGETGARVLFPCTVHVSSSWQIFFKNWSPAEEFKMYCYFHTPKCTKIKFTPVSIDLIHYL